MPYSTISTKGQITLPVSLRRKLGIEPHSRVSVEVTDDAIVIKPAPDFFELKGFLGKAKANEKDRMKQAVSKHTQGK